MNDLRDTIIPIFLIALLTTVQVYGVLAPRTYQLVDGVTAIRLGRGCEVWYFAQPAQPVSTFALACPRMDLMRLWPLPVMQPWSEDTSDKLPGS